MLTTVKPLWQKPLYDETNELHQHILVAIPKRTTPQTHQSKENIRPRSTTPKTPAPTHKINLIDQSNNKCTEQPLDDRCYKRRKISFKIKTTPSLSQNRRQTTLSANKVALLTQKFNQLIHAEPKIARAVRRANSTRLKDPDICTKRPSIKPKPLIKLTDAKRKKISVRRKGSVKKQKSCEPNEPRPKIEDAIATDAPTDIRHKKAVSPGSVKAAIEIFERRKSESNTKTPKYERTNSNELKPNEQLVNSINKILLETAKNPVSTVLKAKVPDNTVVNCVRKSTKTDELSKNNLTELQHYFEKQQHKKQTVPPTCSFTTLINLQLDPQKAASTLSEPQQLLDGLSMQTIEDTVLEVKQIPITNNLISISFGGDTKAKGGLYEGLKLTKTTPPARALKMTVAEDRLDTIVENRRPNTSFLWRSKSRDSLSINTFSLEGQPTNEEEKQSNNTEKNPTTTQQCSLYDHIEVPSINVEDFEALYDTVEPPKIPESPDDGIEKYETILAKTDAILKEFKAPENLRIITQKTPVEETEWQDNESVHSYESFYNSNYEEISLDYEYPKTPIKRTDSNVSEEIYETLSPKSSFRITSHLESNKPAKYPDKPLPDLPPLNIEQTRIERSEEQIYESVYNIAPVQAANVTLCNRFLTQDMLYELVYPATSDSGSNRDSVISCDQSNSLYGRYGLETGLPSGSISDEWVDVSDPEFDEQGEPGFVVVHEGKRHRKNAGWSLKVRDQWRHNRNSQDDAASDHYNHYYESLNSDDDFDSFDSESDDDSFTKINQNDSGVDMGNSQLPEPPGSSGNIYALTRLAATAGKHMKRLRRNWSLTKSDITKSLSRITKKRSATSLTVALEQSSPNYPALDAGQTSPPPIYGDQKWKPPRPAPPPPNTRPAIPDAPDTSPKSYQNVEFNTSKSGNLNSLSRKKNWLKFRRSTSLAADQHSNGPEPEMMPDLNLSLTKSTFYLTSEINADTGEVNPSSHTKHMSIANDQPVVPTRRRTNKPVIALRPQSPPPPAPTQKPVNIEKIIDKKVVSNKKASSQQRSTSWYAECGLFKPGGNAPPLIVPPPLPIAPTPLPQRDKHSSTCWYAEVGLYQKKNSVATSPSSSSAGNSSAGGDTNAPTDVYYNLRNEEQLEEEENSIYYNEERMKRCQSGDVQLLLKDEPLYQFYDAVVAESACQETSSDSDYDGYEEIGRLGPATTPEQPPALRPMAIRSRWGPGGIGRTLWCEVPEVVQSEILSTLTTTQKKVQEAKFELLTSEASYYNSLTLLEDHFIANLDLETLLVREDREILFGLIAEVKRSSEAMLSELEACWQSSILLAGVMDVVLKQSNLEVYVRYCENQVHLEPVLRRCKEKRLFGEVLRGLEASPTCQALSLYSFLMLPMQRITRMPLLVDAILKRLTVNDDEFEVCQEVMKKLNEIVMRCNEGARKAERQTEMKKIAKQLEYPPHVPPVDLNADLKRWLVRSGELIHLVTRNDEVKLTFGKKFTKIPLTLFLFEDVLIVTRKKNDDSYTVVHHCGRNFVELTTSGASELCGLPIKDAQSRHLLFLTMLENQEARTVEMMLSCASETDRQRWIEALSPPTSDNPYETVYESWDCPQVRAVHRYQAGQPDELNLAKGDVVNVNKKMADGWYHGERIRDGVCGWFPGNYTAEIANPHVRARNLKQRYRLLAFTDSYLKKNK